MKMKMRFLLLAAVVSALFLSCEIKEDGYEIGLYVINDSSATVAFCVTEPGVYSSTRHYKTLEKGDEWHFKSIYYGSFKVSTVDANNKDLVSITTYVDKGSEETATLVKWNGTAFTEETVDAE